MVAAETASYRDAASGARSMRTTPGSPVCVPTPTTSTPRCMTAPNPNWARFGRRRAVAQRCGSPASVTNRRRRWTPQSPAHSVATIADRLRAGDITNAVEHAAPLFNLVNGDLCYANLSRDRVRTWSDWFENNSRSARYRPWMPAAGNHENELGNGPIGYSAYQTYFALPDSGADPELRGLWYAFTAGSVRVISLANDDICYQDGGNSYVRGYSGGAQKRWLEHELERTRSRQRNRLGRGVHAPDRGVDRQAYQRCRPGDPGELGAAVRPLRRRSGGVRPRASLRTHSSDPRHPAHRHADAAPVDTQADTSTPARARFTWSSAAEARRSRPTSMFFPSPAAASSWRSADVDPAPATRRPGTSRKPRRGRCFVTATIPAASWHSTSIPGQPGGTTSMAATYYAVNGLFGEVTRSTSSR